MSRFLLSNEELVSKLGQPAEEKTRSGQVQQRLFIPSHIMTYKHRAHNGVTAGRHEETNCSWRTRQLNGAPKPHGSPEMATQIW